MSAPVSSTTYEELDHDSSTRRERLETRISAEEKTLLKRAADLEHQSVTEFVRQSLRTTATETIRRHETMVLSARDSAAFVELLMNPPAPGERLRSAAKAHRELIGEQ